MSPRYSSADFRSDPIVPAGSSTPLPVAPFQGGPQHSLPREISPEFPCFPTGKWALRPHPTGSPESSKLTKESSGYQPLSAGDLTELPKHESNPTP
jgi:hypothetical protein